jgi:hypothetical protein
MNLEREAQSRGINLELTDEEKDHIRAVFFDDIAPKLTKLHARIGRISCEFAGNQYRKWVIQFKSRGSGFEILSFEYDEAAGSIDLDL